MNFSSTTTFQTTNSESFCGALAQNLFSNVDPTVAAVCDAFESFFFGSRGHDDAVCVMMRTQFAQSCQVLHCSPAQCDQFGESATFSPVEIGLIVFVAVAVVAACAIACTILARKRSVSRRIGQFSHRTEASPLIDDAASFEPAMYPPPVSH